MFGDIIWLTAEIIKISREERQKAREDKKQLIEKLETAGGEDIFKYMNLIAFANMDEFVAEARINAQQSFKLCMASAVAGFLIICVSVGFGIWFQVQQIDGMSASYLGSVVGVVTELISAVFFGLYTRTTNQVNRMHDRLLGSQSGYSAVLSLTLITDADARRDQTIVLSNRMMDRLEVLDKTI